MTNPQPDARTALATRAEQQRVGIVAVPITQRIQNLEHDFQLAMPRGLEAKRLIRDALTCLRTIRDLDKCDPDSILGALMTCAQLGLRPGVLGHAWPLPYWDGRTQQHRAQLVIGYQGLVELAHRSGSVASLVARVVRANDHFDIDYGIADTLVHKPELRGPRGPSIGYYAIVKFLSGGYTFWHMTLSEMQEHRDKYAPRNRQGQITGPWIDHFDAQGLKTCIRLLSKYMPKTADFAEAVAADGGLRVNVDPTMPASDVTVDVGMWDSTVVGEPVVAERKPGPADPPTTTTTAAPVVKPQKTEQERLLQQLHIHRSKLDGFAGTSEEAKELFKVHVASVIGRAVTSSKELTEEELQTIITDLKRAKREQDAAKRRATNDGPPPTEPPSEEDWSDTAQPGLGPRPVSQVAQQQSATLRSITDPSPPQDGIPY